MNSQNKRKIYVIGGDNHYSNWMQGQLVKTMEEADLVVFTGGEDVSPYFYKQPAHITTYTNPKRDIAERAEFLKARELKKPMIGICRGAQFLCVMAGGELVQHQENPNYFHKIKTYSGDKYFITSTHHQAQYPWKLNKNKFRIIACSNLRQSDYHLDGNGKELVIGVVEDAREVEIAFYPEIKAYCIQGHPEHLMEYYYKNHKDAVQTIDFLREQLNMFLDESLLEHIDSTNKNLAKSVK